MFIAGTSDYSPFGAPLDVRSQGSDYRYGFQGQEEDDELKEDGNSVSFTYRMHDPRVGRFFAIDTMAGSYSYNSPYAFSENCVINARELEGLEKIHVYNVWYDGNGDKHVKKSHTKIDNRLKADYRVYRYYDGKGKVTRGLAQQEDQHTYKPTILGGDILSEENTKLIYAYQLWGEEYQYLNWYCDKADNESKTDYLQRSYVLAREGVINANTTAEKLKKECYIVFVIE